LKLASLSVAAAAAPAETASASILPGETGAGPKPNIIFVVSDQHRTGLTKREGYPLDTSPALDRLADAGVSFERAYCTAPLCMPSRTSMLTGRWPEATHVRNNFMAGDAYYSKHLYQVAKEQGYKTGLTGKNHTFLKPTDLDFWRHYDLADGYIPPNAPASYHGFEQYMRSLHANVAVKPTPFPVELQYPYRIVSDAIEFIDGSGSQPFILQVGFSEPHDPEQVPAPYFNMFPPDKIPPRCAGPEALKHLGYRARWEFGHQEAGSKSEENWQRYVSNYLGMLRLIDDQLARLVAHLKQKDITRNTVIVYLADHGDYLMDYGLARKGVGLPECLTRIPMIWSGAGVTPTHVGETAFTSMADVMPTLCEVMGAEIPIGVQGRSLWPLLQGKEYPKEEFRSAYSEVGVGGMYYEPSDHIGFSATDEHKNAAGEVVERAPDSGFDELNKVTLSGLQKMCRMGDWKIIFDMMGYGQLYNLKTDPCELNNLFNKPEAAARQCQLMTELCMWTIRSQDALPTGPQNPKYQTKWPGGHNWYTPYRHGVAPEAYIP
jgi:arylsulfatase A-like enzyme